jgi:hypothetical protein
MATKIAIKEVAMPKSLSIAKARHDLAAIVHQLEHQLLPRRLICIAWRLSRKSSTEYARQTKRPLKCNLQRALGV